MKYRHFCLACLILLSAAACKRDREIKAYYRVNGESAPNAEAQPAPATDPHAALPGGVMPGGVTGDPHSGAAPGPPAAGPGSVPSFADNPPARWEKQTLSAMRLASYLVKGEDGTVADVSFSTLARASGGLLANVNRWREQLAQPDLDEVALKQTSQNVNTFFGDGLVVDIEGLAPGADAAKDGRIVGVIAQTDNEAWFFKMRGNAALAAAEKDNFLKWAASVKPAEPGAAPAAVAVPAVPPAGAPRPAADGTVTWKLPDGWKLAPAAGSMRYATLNISGADGTTAELAVTHFPGEVGGDLEKVNYWRDQAALKPVDAAGLAPLITKLTAGPQSLSTIDITGPKLRLIAAWTRHGPDTWFFKLTGPDPLLAAEKARFTAFIDSVRFNQPE